METNNFDFGAWATRYGLKCSDKRVIMHDAFKHNDRAKVPLLWGHVHNDPNRVLGYAILENRPEGVYANCRFNNSASGLAAKEAVAHGDIEAVSIYANGLREKGVNPIEVFHGNIKELSLVVAGANPGAFIDYVLSHEEGADGEGIIYANDHIPLDILMHASDDNQADENGEGAKEETNVSKEKTLLEAFNDAVAKLDKDDQDAVYGMLGEALDAKTGDNNSDDNNEEENEMKHNAFENEQPIETGFVLSHEDQKEILKLAQTRRVGTLQHAIQEFVENTENEALQHAFVNEDGAEAIETLFPDYKDVKPGAPELIERDYGWVGVVMKGVHKSPVSRIRTRQADARAAEITAKGYKKGAEKTKMGNIKLLGRTTDPQTVFVKETMHRDDIIDITEFGVVDYLHGVMRRALDEKLALCFMIGDGLEDGDADKVAEEHIRPIWTDDDLYTIHQVVDINKMKAELQGTNTSANFGENYIYAEAIVQASLYARETYKGSGNMSFFCEPHLLNVMKLARDLNGRRVYSTDAELTSALNAKAIHTAEQFAGKIRTAKDGKKYKLLGIFVNLDDYHVGSTKGGEVTSFKQFDIDYNQEKYLIEGRCSGALVRPWSAIVLEVEVTD